MTAASDTGQTGTSRKGHTEDGGAARDVLQSRKAAVRAAALARRAALDPQVRIEGGLALVAHVDALDFHQGAIVSGFWPIRDEIDPRPLMDALRARGHSLCLPAIVEGELVFRRLTRETVLVRAGFGTAEPPSDADELIPDCMLVPLAAFDLRGARIGYGRGYYDRAIARIARQLGQPPATVGLAFSAQGADAVPEEAHDQRLDRILTEAGLMEFKEHE
ncbi:5-formyltetrahydrofolate cyclo-ligase [Stappia sp. ES.058]|uniref:5-formyltetrahydrofolate cyclo-ligase n=1 Tax=Stappia sp. ES.058 TaxID=1881061 RepID=UPI00087AA9C0|nr:5-formyltetrahydrofolate cyclo-ligase [Stappia sp. ES.058]SDU35089.1 5-formyltetrahydrofolate cyclo-ligase [Stappia sp. ES.058]